MKIPIGPILFLFFSGMGLFAQPAPDPREAPSGTVPAAPVISPVSRTQEIRIRLAVLPDNPRPGDPLTIGYVPETGDAAGLRVSILNAQGQRLSRAAFFDPPGDNQNNLKTAIAAIPSTAKPGLVTIRVENGSGGVMEEVSVILADRDFVSEEIVLDQGNTNLRTVPDPQKTAESEQLWGILSRTGTDIYAAGPFTAPVTSTRRTSFFGDRRVYRYVNGSTGTSIHAGVDFGVPTGTPVMACAAGKVALARPRIVTGNSVVLEHLPGVYSIYYHLDTIQVREGAMVNAGTILGTSGSTGLATGPHLHWEIRVSGENTDPDAFIARCVLDKEAILRKIYN